MGGEMEASRSRPIVDGKCEDTGTESQTHMATPFGSRQTQLLEQSIQENEKKVDTRFEDRLTGRFYPATGQ
jgi:hypothetical protein